MTECSFINHCLFKRIELTKGLRCQCTGTDTLTIICFESETLPVVESVFNFSFCVDC